MENSFFWIIAIIILVLLFNEKILLSILSLFFKPRIYPPVRVFISYSFSRSPQWVGFLYEYLFPVFNRYNITFFEYLKHNSTNPEQIRQLIDNELAKADVYIRCLDERLQPVYNLSREFNERIIKGREDFLYYETQEASHKLNSPKIKIILALDAQRLLYSLDEVTANLIYISSSQNPLSVAHVLAQRVHELYASYLLSQQNYSNDEVGRLIWSLTCGNIGIRENAACRLGKIGDVRAVEPLIDALHDNNWRVRGAAVCALAKIGIPAIEPLIRSSRDTDWGFRASVVRTLGEIGDSKAIDTLISALDDEDSMVRGSAAIALAKIGDCQAIKPLISALELEVNPKLVEALGKFKAARTVEPLIAATNNPSHYTRWVLAEALGMIGEPALEPLITVLGDKANDWTMRQSAAWALGDMEDTVAIEPLIAALGDNDENVKQATAWALSAIGNARAVDPLINVLEDDFWVTRMKAIDALKRIGDARAIGPLEKLVQSDTHKDVQLAAKEALARLSV